MTRMFVICLLLAPLLSIAQPAPAEQPVGVVLLASGTRLLRNGTETPLNARPGDLLFAGDALRTETGAITFLYCPGNVSHTLQPRGEVLLQAKQLKLKTGAFSSSQAVAACQLPTVVRVAAASRQHYGVTMVRSLGQPVDAAPAKLPPEVQAEIDAVGTAAEPASIVARATVYEKAGLHANALREYREAAKLWSDAVWVKGKIFELQEKLTEEAARKASSPNSGGRTFAVLVGISKYQKLPQDLWLQFANADAIALYKHLRSPRGGAVPAENMHLLTDEKATTSALRSVLQTVEQRHSGAKDTIILFLAGHGIVEVPGSKSAFIVTYDSDPQDLSSTGLPMAEIQDLIQRLAQTGRVVALVDVCRSGTIGTIRSTSVNTAVERLGEAEGEMLGFMASRPREVSYEGPQFGGGHGAFSYYLLKALGGDADKNDDGVVNVNELIEYVRTNVATATNDKQHPRDFGNIENSTPLSDVRKPGIEVARMFRVIEAGDEPVYLASAAPALGPPPVDVSPFSNAVESGRLLPEQPGNAFEQLRKFETSLPPEQYLTLASQLRVALENQAQQILLKYLAGDEIPQVRQDFVKGADFASAALRLAPDSLYLDARRAFFEGRALLFDKQYKKGADLLETCLRLDPSGAYSYNALGIAWLEQGQFAPAISAFRDAIARAPHWIYPLHNLALAQVEAGEYDAALRTYKEAIRLRPEASYLPYNMGLVYQRLNLSREAGDAYRKAAALAPDSAEPLNALGALKSSTGNYREAEALFRQALQRDPTLLAARHNLALTVAHQKSRYQEAVDLWRQNLAASPDHLPSLLALAEVQEQSGDIKGAISSYGTAVKLKPGYPGARIALSRLLERSGDVPGALREMLAAAESQKEDPVIQERLGDLHAASGDKQSAAREYNRAMQTADKRGRKRITQKLAGLGGAI
jgi:tetratricopeptide (TPR) repeat protein